MGAAYLLTSYGQILPLIGLGLGLVFLTRTQTALALVLFVIGIPAGLLGEYWLISHWLLGSSTTKLLTIIAFVAPICCVLPGVALLLRGVIGAWIATIAAPLLGVAVGFAIAFGSPTDRWQFPASAGTAALWLTVAPRGLLAPFQAPWLKIGSRIFASWLLAIALLLGSSALLGQPSQVVTPPTAAPTPMPAQEGLPLQPTSPGTTKPSWLGKPAQP